MTFSKIIVTGLLVFSLGFVIVILYIFLKTGQEPVALISFVGASIVAELWQLSVIKREEVKHGTDKKNQSQLSDKAENTFYNK